MTMISLVASFVVMHLRHGLNRADSSG